MRSEIHRLNNDGGAIVIHRVYLARIEDGSIEAATWNGYPVFKSEE